MWIIIAAGSALILMLLFARFVRFRVNSGDASPSGQVRVSRLSAKKEFVVRGPDGREQRFSSLDEMPLEMRAAIERAEAGKPAATRIVVEKDGVRQEYESFDDAPPDVRERFNAVSRELPKGGIVIEMDGHTHYFASEKDIPDKFRKFLRPGDRL